MMRELPERAQVVIIGGGIVGCSTAYHLTELGRRDVVVLEQGRLSSGTTWHAAGLVGQLRSQQSMTRLIQYSTDLYARIEAETGLASGWKQCGSVSVARTPERMTQLRRTAAAAAAYGVEAEVITPRRAQELWPVMRVDDLVGGVWLPGDGKANPTDLTNALARGARQCGASVFERVRVTAISTANGRVTGVETDRGTIEAEIVVNCAGQWAKQIGLLAGVNVPLHSAEHYYVVTEPIEGVHTDLPVLRDPDGFAYYKEEVGGLVVGGFEPDAKPWVAPDELPYPFEFRLLAEDWDQFAPIMENAFIRVPALEHTGIRKFYNGPESFTPDNNFLLGEAPGLRGFFVGAGFNSMGIASAGGAGRALAEWIVNGEPTTDLWPVDLRRFDSYNANNTWLRDRVREVLGLHYAMPWPNRELDTARPFRRSPAYHLLRDAGANFGSKMGWERANFFAPPGQQPVIEYSFGRQNWHDWCNAEQVATRNDVAIFDQTSFAKYVVTGRDAASYLQWLCTADVDVPVGRTVYTGMLNERGTYESDLTVTRTGDDEFLLVSGSAQPVRDLDWIRRNIPADRHVAVVDVTSSYAVYGVMGPRSRDLLRAVSRADLSNEGFEFGSSREIDLGYATVRATRVTYVGELGWELYVPAEFAVGVYETLVAAGKEFGLVNGGYYAINAMRLEKGYRAFAAELTPDDNPVEAGLLFACKLRTDHAFLGREAVEKAKAEGPRRRLASFVLADPGAVLWGGELILRDGEPVGHLTSAAYGATVGAAVGLGYVKRHRGVADTDWLKAASYEIDVAGERHPATMSLRPPYDPASERVKC
jgi:glycine cleavage system aminomethyltransferase T/glycine/D-amino acid oxidase-like deaminating enzyme